MKRLLIITLGSFFFFGLKIALVESIELLLQLPLWCNYLLVTSGTTLLGWVYHSKFSFQVALNKRSLLRYLQQVVALKALDYLLFNIFAYSIGLSAFWSVFGSSCIVFILRVTIYIKYVFVPIQENSTHEQSLQTRSKMNSSNQATLPIVTSDVLTVEAHQEHKTAVHESYLGDYLKIYCGFKTQSEKHSRVAAGGLVTTLLATALRENIVDGVAISKIDFSEGNIGYRFDIVTDPDKIKEYGKSVYFNIPIEKHWKELDQFAGRLAICALPCHMRTLTRRKNENRGLENVKLFISLFCGHNNEIELVRFFFNKAGIVEADIADMLVERSYLGGNIRIILRDGSQKLVPFRDFNVYRSLWFFSKQMCRYCEEHLGATADLSIGDVFTPEYRKQKIRHSALMARTKAGLDLVEIAMEQGAIDVEPIDSSVIFRAQKRLLVPSADLMSKYHACRITGFTTKRPEGTRFRWRSFLTYSLLNINDRISRTSWGPKLLKWVPRPFLYAYIAVIKLINNTLGAQR